MTRRAYIEVRDRSPFGEEIDEELLNDPGKDSTFIEGYSDVRTKRELALRRGEHVRPLRHRLQWVRAKTLDGQKADGKQVMHWKVDKGYRPMKYDEAVEAGYFVDKNPAIEKGEDGFAYHGEQILMVADAKTAATNLRKVQRDSEEMLAKPQRDMEAAVERFNRDTKGAHAASFSFVGDDPDDIAKGKVSRKQ